MSGRKRYRMFIDGQWADAGDGGTFASHNPTTGEAWAEIPEATAADIDRAVKAAHRAFTEGPWATALPTARGKYLRRLADLLAQKSEDLGRTETVDTGKKSERDALAGQIHRRVLPLLCRRRRQGDGPDPSHR